MVGLFAPGEPDRPFPQGVGTWRVIARTSPDLISADEIVAEAQAVLDPPRKPVAPLSV